MSEEAKVSESTGDNAIDILSKMTSQGIPVDSVLESMDPKDVIKFLMGQYNLLHERYTSLESQFRDLQTSMKDECKDTTQRIDRILSLMTSNMMFIKQMIQLEDVNNEKLNEQDKLNAKQELQFTGLIDRQNRFANSLVSIDNNTKAIVKELTKLKNKSIKQDQFNFRLTVIGSIILTVGAWLLTGDNLAKLVVALSQFVK